MDFALIETLRWEPGAGFVRGGLHLDRLRASAEALGFIFDEVAVLVAMEGIAAGDAALRVRLELARDGQPSTTASPFVAHSPETVWTVAIASTRLASTDPLLRHKTTRRDVYKAARAEFPASEIDEVILLNEAGFICEGTITNIFVRREQGGPLLTPPLSCGLLPGVLRRALVETGAVYEEMLTPEDLAAAAQVFCGNSLRGLIPAMLV